jgi:hypothetical protein
MLPARNARHGYPAFVSPMGQTRDTVTWKGTSEPGTYTGNSAMAAKAPSRRNGPSGK